MNEANFRATDLLTEFALLNSAFLFVEKTLQMLTKKKVEFDAISYSSVKDDRSQHGMPHTATQNIRSLLPMCAAAAQRAEGQENPLSSS